MVFRLEGEEEEPEGQDRGLRGEAGLRVWVERLGGESGWRVWVERDLLSLGGHIGRRGGRTECLETVGRGSGVLVIS